MLNPKDRAVVMKAEKQPNSVVPVISYEPLNADGSVSDGLEMGVLQMEQPGVGTKSLQPMDTHLIIDGKSFAVVKEHCSEDLMKNVLYCYGNTLYCYDNVTILCISFSCWSKGQSLPGCHLTRRLSWL